MPTKFVQNTAERMGVSVEHAEKVWHDAKQAVKKGKRQGSWYWGKVVNTFKRMMGIKEQTSFKEFLVLEGEQPVMPRYMKLAGPYVAEKEMETEHRTVYRVKKMLSDDIINLQITAWYGRSQDDTGGMWTFRPATKVDDILRAEINYDKGDMSSIGVRNAKALQAWARSHMQNLIDRKVVDQVTTVKKDA